MGALGLPDGSDGPVPAIQQRTTQSRVNTSRLVGGAANAAQRAPSGGSSRAPNDAGRATQPDCGDKWVTLAGRSRVIHMLWKGFLFVGVDPGEKPWAAARSSTWPACAGTPGAAWVHAAGSGSADAENWGRNDEPAIRATKRLSAVTIAVVDCHRRVVPASQRSTVAALYGAMLGRQPTASCENAQSPVRRYRWRQILLQEPVRSACRRCAA
jgi:hypothetical protein